MNDSTALTVEQQQRAEAMTAAFLALRAGIDDEGLLSLHHGVLHVMTTAVADWILIDPTTADQEN